MPLKSSTERDLLYLLALLLGTGTVKDMPKLAGTWPVRIIRLKSLASTAGNNGWQNIKCSVEMPSKPAAFPRFILLKMLSTNSASKYVLWSIGFPQYSDLICVYLAVRRAAPSLELLVHTFAKCCANSSAIEHSSVIPLTWRSGRLPVSNLDDQHFQNTCPCLFKRASWRSLV